MEKKALKDGNWVESKPGEEPDADMDTSVRNMFMTFIGMKGCSGVLWQSDRRGRDRKSRKSAIINYPR
jgi:hypothetical protein